MEKEIKYAAVMNGQVVGIGTGADDESAMDSAIDDAIAAMDGNDPMWCVPVLVRVHDEVAQ